MLLEGYIYRRFHIQIFPDRGGGAIAPDPSLRARAEPETVIFLGGTLIMYTGKDKGLLYDIKSEGEVPCPKTQHRNNVPRLRALGGT